MHGRDYPNGQAARLRRLVRCIPGLALAYRALRGLYWRIRGGSAQAPPSGGRLGRGRAGTRRPPAARCSTASTPPSAQRWMPASSAATSPSSLRSVLLTRDLVLGAPSPVHSLPATVRPQPDGLPCLPSPCRCARARLSSLSRWQRRKMLEMCSLRAEVTRKP